MKSFKIFPYIEVWKRNMDVVGKIIRSHQVFMDISCIQSEKSTHQGHIQSKRMEWDHEKLIYKAKLLLLSDVKRV